MAAKPLAEETQSRILELHRRYGNISRVAVELGIDRASASKYVKRAARQSAVTGTTQPPAAQVSPDLIEAAVQEALQKHGLLKPAAPSVSDVREIKHLNKKTLIVTGWEIRVKPAEKFIDCLLQMQREYDAELVATPVWAADLPYLQGSWAEKFRIALEDFTINNNFRFKYCPTQALQVSPVQRWRGLPGSIIIPGLVQDLITEPSHRLARQVMATGSIGRLDASLTDYSQFQDEEMQRQLTRRWATASNRRGASTYAVAQQFTVPSALIVDIIDDQIFLSRYVSMIEDGVVYDLNRKFIAGHTQSQSHRPEGLVMGDLHSWHTDSEAWNATLDMQQVLKPRRTVTHDGFDGASCNRHIVGRPGYFSMMPTIAEEGRQTRERVDRLGEDAEEIIWINSNHCNFLNYYLDDPSLWRLNGNYSTCLELEKFRYDTGRHPIIKLLGLDEIANLRFVSEREDYQIAGVTQKHGHEGKSGKRVPMRALAPSYGYKLTKADSHVPEVFRGSINVGTLSVLDPDYVKGASAWMHANGIIHPDGSQQLLPIIYGKWRAGRRETDGKEPINRH